VLEATKVRLIRCIRRSSAAVSGFFFFFFDLGATDFLVEWAAEVFFALLRWAVAETGENATANSNTTNRTDLILTPTV
jgi:hypothetical protein